MYKLFQMKEKTTPKARSLTEPKTFVRKWKEDSPIVEYRYVTSDGKIFKDMYESLEWQAEITQKTCDLIMSMERDERGILSKFIHKLLDKI